MKFKRGGTRLLAREKLFQKSDKQIGRNKADTAGGKEYRSSQEEMLSRGAQPQVVAVKAVYSK